MQQITKHLKSLTEPMAMRPARPTLTGTEWEIRDSVFHSNRLWMSNTIYTRSFSS
jgi:hypothetical protein